MFNPIHIGQSDMLYPSALRFSLADRAPAIVTARGNLDILRGQSVEHRSPTIALFCSIQCSGNLILQTYDLACALRDAGATVISGFHSPMEKECLLLLLRGTQPVIICPARGIDNMRLPADWKVALTRGRLLLLSPFAEKLHRVTTRCAQQRNEFVAALADVLFVAFAAPGSKTERFCCDVLAWGKPLLTLDSEENAGLLALGARAVGPEGICRDPVFAQRS
ncbi:MAG: DNA-processing protein DprA [Candidatus Binatia bacterium]